MQRKAERKKLIEKRNQTHDASVATKVPPPNALTVREKSHPFLTKDTIPRALVESPEQDAIYSFFTEFILHTTHPDSQCGIFEHLLPLYTSARHDSVLSLAASAVALAISGGAPHRRSRFQMGRVINGIALKKVALAIQDPIQSVQDQTLMAVLLLGFFDVSMPFLHSPVFTLIVTVFVFDILESKILPGAFFFDREYCFSKNPC